MEIDQKLAHVYFELFEVRREPMSCNKLVVILASALLVMGITTRQSKPPSMWFGTEATGSGPIRTGVVANTSTLS